MEMIQVKEAGESLNDNFESENNWFEREQCADEKYHGHHLTKNLKRLSARLLIVHCCIIFLVVKYDPQRNPNNNNERYHIVGLQNHIMNFCV